MTTCESNNIYNIAVKGNFDDCQKLVKQMFNDEKFREKLICQALIQLIGQELSAKIVYYFLCIF